MDAAADRTDQPVEEVPESVMRELLFKSLSQKIRILDRHKKERKPIIKRKKRKPKPRPKNRAALVRKQKKAR